MRFLYAIILEYYSSMNKEAAMSILGKDTINDYYSHCTLCPRACGVNRLRGEIGFCGQTKDLVVARAALHFWEEPCISGTKGSGTVFFGGCNLKCIFCQNHEIANGNKGKIITTEHLAEIFLSLQEQGANNINLVTPTPSVLGIIEALTLAKQNGLSIPIVYNTGGYESVEVLKMLDGLIDIYLPDFKYADAALSKEYSYAEDYFTVAANAIAEMFRQTGTPVYTIKDGQDLMTRGVIVRHLLLPGETKNAKKILRYLKDSYQDQILISVMSQYTPLPHVAEHEKLNHAVSKEEYQKLIRFCEQLHMDNVFIQEGDCAKESFIPPFDETGV